MLVPEDDLCHELPESEFARESLFYTVPLAEQRMLIEGYVTIRRDRVASRAVMVWGDPDRDGYGPLAADLAAAPMEGRDLDDFTVAGMRVRQPELLRRVEVSFRNGDRYWDLRFRAAHDAFDYESNAAGCPKMVAENRYEQVGVADGSLVLDGRRSPTRASLPTAIMPGERATGRRHTTGRCSPAKRPTGPRSISSNAWPTAACSITASCSATASSRRWRVAAGLRSHTTISGCSDASRWSSSTRLGERLA